MPEKEKTKISNKKLTFYKGEGCEACHGIGFKGRIGIYEILLITEKIEQSILSGKISEHEIERSAIEDGMVTMLQDGVLKAIEGLTSLEEIFRVIE